MSLDVLSLYVVCNSRQQKLISSWGINKAYCIVLQRSKHQHSMYRPVCIILYYIILYYIILYYIILYYIILYYIILYYIILYYIILYYIILYYIILYYIILYYIILYYIILYYIIFYIYMRTYVCVCVCPDALLIQSWLTPRSLTRIFQSGFFPDVLLVGF